ncbi:hypothetical protein LSAT2_010747 [Lamellibrachia satsuma]|nr:hypothetical protein LSAT2_010747 [Lamellibrachia satsuma]
MHLFLFVYGKANNDTFKGLGKQTEEDGELVLVKELGSGRMRRSAESTLQQHLHMQFSVAGERMVLQLVQNTDIDMNVPFRFAENKKEQIYIPNAEAIALYQDSAQGAAILISKTRHVNGGHVMQLEGSFHVKDKSYIIEPTDNVAPVPQDGVTHRVINAEMPKDYFDVAKEKNVTVNANTNDPKMSKGEAKHREKRDTTVAAYYVEVMFPRVCLNNRVCSNGVSTADEDILPGTVYSLDDQCQMFYGENYTYYGDVAAVNETICSAMSCVDDNQQVDTTTRGAIVGTPCGTNKVRQTSTLFNG